MQHRSKKGVALFATGLMALSIGLAGCGSSVAAHGDTIKLGSIISLTGKESKIGSAQADAYQFAVKQYNDAGGVKVGDKTYKIDLKVTDDTTDPAKSAQLMEQAINEDKVDAILGGYSTPVVSAQALVPDRYGIPYINPGGASRGIYGKSKWVFGTLSPVDVMATNQMEFLKTLMDAGKLPKPSKIALVWENSDHGKDYQKGVQDFAKANPSLFQVSLDEGFTLYGTDFKPLLQKVQAANADIFMVDAHLEDYVTMHRQYTQLGMKHKMVTYGARGPDSSARTALGAATDYIFASGWWNNQLPYPQVKKFNDAWAAAHDGKKPEWYQAAAYEAVRALVTAMQNAGSFDKEKVRAALAKTDLKDSIMPGGELKFTASGQAVYNFPVTQNLPGNKVAIVYPLVDATGPAVAPIPN